MEIDMHSHRWSHRQLDWTAAIVSGFAAGALLMVLELLWSATGVYASPWTTSYSIAAMVLGPEVLRTSEFSLWIVSVALVTHYVLGIVFALVLAGIISAFHLDTSMGMALLVGATFGIVLYLFNFYGMTIFFPWMEEMRGLETLVAHVIFGMAVAAMYLHFEGRAEV